MAKQRCLTGKFGDKVCERGAISQTVKLLYRCYFGEDGAGDDFAEHEAIVLGLLWRRWYWRLFRRP